MGRAILKTLFWSRRGIREASRISQAKSIVHHSTEIPAIQVSTQGSSHCSNQHAFRLTFQAGEAVPRLTGLVLFFVCVVVFIDSSKGRPHGSSRGIIRVICFRRFSFTPAFLGFSEVYDRPVALPRHILWRSPNRSILLAAYLRFWNVYTVTLQPVLPTRVIY